ncbi:hypothetical protein ACFYYN_18475 [Streptomyces sp. NPDC001902]
MRQHPSGAWWTENSPEGAATRPRRVRAAKAYASRKHPAYLRRRGIRCTIPDKADQARNRRKRGSHGGRPSKFDPEDYRELMVRHEATVLVGAVNEWLRPAHSRRP